MKLNVELTKAQYDALKEHAEKRHRSLPEDIILIWWGRMKALATYAARLAKGEKLNPHLPRTLNEEEREALRVQLGFKSKPPKPTYKSLVKAKVIKPKKGKKARIKPGKEGGYRIDLYDVEGVALSKAKLIAQSTGKSVTAVLKEAGRDARGKMVKP